MSETATRIGQRIRELRETEHLSQRGLADRLHMTQAAVSNWESGKRVPGLDDLIAVARALGRDVNDFLPEQRTPARVLLRATAESLDQDGLGLELRELSQEIESLTFPTKEISIGADRPARAARELLEAAEIGSSPIPVRKLAERCGVLVIDRQFEDALSGLIIEAAEGAVIAVNDEHAAVRQRFTIAHELGHHLLGHHDEFHIDVGGSEHGHPPGYDWRNERAANEFAAELLMPSRLVDQAHSSGRESLAQLFEVSALAMDYRLRNLGLR